MKLRTLKPLRGNWQSVAEHAANGRSATKFSRSEVIKNVTADNKRADILANFRARFQQTTKRVANVRKVNGGFHVIGLGLQPLTLNELKVRLAVRGDSAFRIGGLTFEVDPVK